MNISLSYPAWYILLCLLLGGAYAFFFYRKDKLLEDVAGWLRVLLGFFRFAIVSVIAMLLLEPLLESISTKVEKPVIVIAQDNSESLLVGKDSSFLKTDYLKTVEQLIRDLGDEYEVQTYTFGSGTKEGLDIDYSAKTTNISELYEEIFTRYYNRNVGAVVVATDGIYNNGSDPQYAAEKLKNTSLYTVALGDTTPRKDLIINDVAHNRLAYLGNDFPVEVAIKGKDLSGTTSLVSIVKGGKTLASQPITLNSDDFFTVVPFKLEASRTGLQKYTVVVKEVEGELTLENNQQDIFIDILDSKQKILILAGTPSPDVGAFKVALEQNKNYEVEVEMLNDFTGEFKEYTLVVAHQVPFSRSNGNQSKKLDQSGVPVLYVVGSQSDFRDLNTQKSGLKIVGPRGLTEAQAIVNKGFSLFSMDDNFQRQVEKYPPLSLPFASDYKLSNSAEVLLYQKVGSARTKFPLLAFNKTQDKKFGVVLGEGMWRWRIADYQENRSHQKFDDFVGKIVQYLASKEDKSYFRVFSKADYREDEDVIIDAELYNESYELINDYEVQLSLFNQEGEEFNYSFAPTAKAYRLDFKRLPAGEYKYVARVDRAGDVFEQKGEFSVSELKIEMLSATANHQVLYNIADKGNGKMYYPGQLTQLRDDILNKKDIVDVSYSDKEVTDLINWKWIFFGLLALLSLEWFLRKRNGAY